jgi:AcrR family transcriptional regulator
MTDQIPPVEKPSRRRRRTQAEVVQRIVDAARATFTEVGYAAATTRDIARRADVSETLLFRHFGTKASLFDHVVFTPFDLLASQFLATHEAAGAAATPNADRDFLRAFLGFLDGHRVLLTTLAVKGLAETDDERASVRLAAMRSHYRRAAALLGLGRQAGVPGREVDPDLGVRLGFGMILAASLFAEWLFPDGPPPEAQLIDGIDHMLTSALVPGLPAGH